MRFKTNMTSKVLNQLRFAAIRTNNSQQCPSVKNMGGMSTNLWGNDQHKAQ